MLKETKIALFISLCVGLIYLFPHIIYALEDGPYNPLYVTPGRAFLDEAIYAAGVQEVLEGTIVPTDLMVIDNKNGSFIYGPFPFIVIALLSLSGGIVGAIIISDFLFAAFGFFLFYLLAKKIVQSHRLALIGAILFVFFYRLFIPPPIIFNIRNNLSPNQLILEWYRCTRPFLAVSFHSSSNSHFALIRDNSYSLLCIGKK